MATISNAIHSTFRTLQTLHQSLLCKVAVLGLVLGTVPFVLLTKIAATLN